MSEPIKIVQGGGSTDAIAILPGQYVSFFNVELPDLPRAKLDKILPGILADYVAGDIKNTHLSIIEKYENGKYLVAACDHKWLELARTKSSEEGKTLKAIWPDYALLDIPEQGISVMHLSGRVLARRANGTGFNVKETLLETVIGDQSCSRVHESRKVPGGAGLATGKYGASVPVMIYAQTLKRLALIVAVGLFLWVIYGWLTISQLDRDWNKYQEAAVYIFKKTYPDVTKIVNVEAQMRAMSAEGEQGGRVGFVRFADTVFKAVSETAGVRIESLDFDGSGAYPVLNIAISSPTYSQASLFETNLTRAGFTLSQGESTRNAENVISRYTIREDGDE